MGTYKKLFFILKITRLQKGVDYLNITNIMYYFQYYNIEIRIKNMILNDYEKANDIDADNTYISNLL